MPCSACIYNGFTGLRSTRKGLNFLKGRKDAVLDNLVWVPSMPSPISGPPVSNVLFVALLLYEDRTGYKIFKNPLIAGFNVG